MTSVVRAVKRGHLPGELAAPEPSADGEVPWPDFVTLELGGPPLTIRGRVVDEHGEPLEGVAIQVLEPTVFGFEASARIWAKVSPEDFRVMLTSMPVASSKLRAINWHQSSCALQ